MLDVRMCLCRAVAGLEGHQKAPTRDRGNSEALAET